MNKNPSFHLLGIPRCSKMPRDKECVFVCLSVISNMVVS